MHLESDKISKLTVLDRPTRIVSYKRGLRTIKLMLKGEPRCNAGDVQRVFNHHISHGRPEEALTYLSSKTDRIL